MDLAADQIILLLFIWLLWCLPHSLLLWGPLRSWLEARLKLSPAAYRAWYSIFSLVSAAPAIWYTWRLGGLWPFFWPGAWLYAQLALWALASGLMFWADRTFKRSGFDLMGFSGLGGNDSPQHRLVVQGPYAHCRNPMHLAGLAMLWARAMGPADLALNLLLTAYILLGNWLEEGRLKRQFGPAYEAYRRQTPMLGWRMRPGREAG